MINFNVSFSESENLDISFEETENLEAFFSENRLQFDSNVGETINGKSAYEIWLAKGNVGTEDDFLAYRMDNVELTENKAKTIDENSTDKQYPSAKATYQLFDTYSGGVNALLETVINGGG